MMSDLVAEIAHSIGETTYSDCDHPVTLRAALEAKLGGGFSFLLIDALLEKAARSIIERIESSGRQIVPADPTEEMLAALHDTVLIRAEPALRECSILNDRAAWAAVLSAAPKVTP